VNKANTTTTITSDAPDPSDVGQAVTVHYTATVNAPGSGTPTGNVTVSDGVNSCTSTVVAGQCDVTLTTSGPRTLTATYAGDSNFNGSPSAGEPHTVNPPAGTDLAVSATHTPEPVPIAEQVSLQVQLHNNGAGDAASVTLTDTLPASMTFLSASLPGWSCTAPAVGTTGSVSCTKATFANGGTATLTIVARTSMAGSFDNTAQVTTTTNDTSPGNESDSDSVTVSPNARGCTIVGTPGADVIDGTAGADVICGWGGADQIDGKGGDDRILGQGGADVLTGGAGADKLLGGGGNDTLHAGDGLANDIVDGQSGVDTCTADPGDTVKHCE
jgi:uncharacterized repeat protein (TIGR01451 family)